MKRSTARWTTAIGVAALLAVPSSGFAQTAAAPPSQPAEPTQSAPQAQTIDAEAAKKHLVAARNSLSEMAQLPAAAQLTGDTRTQVAQLIANFNELITTNSQWRESYAKVDANLTALLGSETTDESAARTTASGTAGAVGTSGTAGAIDPAIRAKLVDFRNHLEKFEQAAGGAKPAAAPEPASAAAVPPAAAAQPPAAQTMTSAPAATATQSGPIDPQEVLRHIQAIEALLVASGASGAATPTGTSGTATTAATQSGLTLTAEQVAQLKTHLNDLKRVVQK